MQQPIIEIHYLSKKYRLGTILPYYALRDTITQFFSRSRKQEEQSDGKDVWVLNDVSLNVYPGEIVGIIGRNGAGKSTLLKILSRITSPTKGEAILRGRVASLLEVGTGFHPELTGRENIFLNGTILGMKQSEIREKFNDIISFAEIDSYIDTPVKFYSSGMYTRLAFSVAAHLEPEILIVDEVLAVGDGAFQKKCLGKMNEVSQRDGRTVLFVSHNMAAIQSLCTKTLWLRQGSVQAYGETAEITAAYTDSLTTSAAISSADTGFTIEKILLKNKLEKETSSFNPGEPLTIEMHYVARKRFEKPAVWFSVESNVGPCFGANMLLDGNRPNFLQGKGILTCTFSSLPLLPRQYTIRMAIRGKDGKSAIIDPQEITTFTVAGSYEKFGFHGEWFSNIAGRSNPMTIPYTWVLPDGTKNRVAIQK